jgi:hypothetical protein
MMQSALSKEMGISQLQESYNHVGATCTPVFHKRITRTRHVQRYGRLLPTCTCCLMLVSWFGNKIRGNIQCRAVGTFLAHLAPLLLPLVPPQYLHNCFYFFPHSVLFIDYVMSLPFFFWRSCSYTKGSIMLGHNMASLLNHGTLWPC